MEQGTDFRYRPQAMVPRLKKGYCRAIVGDIQMAGNSQPVRCGRMFFGPANQENCDEHSNNVKYRGKS